MDFVSFPKIELHLHLDCSLSYEVVKAIDPSISYEFYKNDFIAPAKCSGLADYISRAVNGISLMQTRENLQLVVRDVFRQLVDDNVIYAEIRFAPLLHTQQQLTAEDVVSIVNDTTGECIRETGIYAGIILCTLRHYSEQQSMETVQLVNRFKGTHVVGFDIAADEAGFPIDNHKKAFAFAKDNEINCTAHAGEAKGAESVWETLEHFHPKRIGHGVRSVEDEKLLEHLKANKIHLEVCPTSNIQTNVFNTMEHQVVDKIFNWGVSMSINTDARTISNVSLADEYATLEQYFKWTIRHFLQCNLEAINHAFATGVIKEQIRQRLLTYYLPYLNK